VIPAWSLCAASPPTATPAQGKDKLALNGNQARVIVHLPKEARLFVNDVPCPLTSDVRSFDSPPLKSTRSYSYILRAEVDRDGKVVTQTQRVRLVAGQDSTVHFGDLKSSIQTAQR
jgi:uncharacterized protein (TIGR03000 family)